MQASPGKALRCATAAGPSPPPTRGGAARDGHPNGHSRHCEVVLGDAPRAHVEAQPLRIWLRGVLCDVRCICGPSQRWRKGVSCSMAAQVVVQRHGNITWWPSWCPSVGCGSLSGTSSPDFEMNRGRGLARRVHASVHRRILVSGEMEFFTVILEKSSTLVLPHNFVKMLDGHRPQNMKLRQAGNGLRKLWVVEVVFDADGRMYLDRGWKQFVRAYDLGIGYFLVFRSSEYCDRCYVYGSSDSGDSKSSSDDGPAMDVPQLGDRAMPIVVEEYIPQPGLGLRRSKRIKMMKEKVKKQE
ncbi:putative B3 domain-containing protein [Hordeum vulgare]|nr:putative B3 domain-containing protein [Hordeum vulgare]